MDQEATFKTYRVRYLSRTADNPTAKLDPTSPDYWVCEDIYPAKDAESALKQVIAEGRIPVQAKWVRQNTSHVPADYKLKFMMAIRFAVEAGDSVGTALEKTIESEQWPLRGQLDPALRMLRAGSTFTEALYILQFYDETTLAILGAGEHTGTMAQALGTALQHLQRKSTADNLMKGAVTMIMVDIMMAMSSSMSAVFGLLPQAEKQGIQTKDTEALAQWSQAIQVGYISNWILLAGAMIALIFSLVAWLGYEYGKPSTREKVEQALRRLPYLGPALLHDGVSVSTGIASHLLKGGVLFDSAVEITARAIRLPGVKQYWHQVQSLTLAGAPTTTAMARAPMTGAERRVLAAHTNAEQLSEALAQISVFRQEQSTKANKRFVVMGLVGSFLYSALGIASTLYVNYIQITAIMSTSSV